jgi:hypothetical protein
MALLKDEVVCCPSLGSWLLMKEDHVFFFFYDRSFFMASAFFQAVLLDDDREVRRHSFSAFLVVDSADLQLSFPQGTGNNA